MSTDIEKAMELAADAAAGAISSLKRKNIDEDRTDEPQLKSFKTEAPSQTPPPPPTTTAPPQTSAPEVHVKTEAASEAPVKTEAEDAGSAKKPTYTRAREIRLEQNRKAAKESRRRKKVMIEELQRSVIFFSRANSTLKQQNDELTRLLMQAQSHITAFGTEDKNVVAVQPPQPQHLPQAVKQEGSDLQMSAEQAQAQAVATQALFESQGFPAAAARAAAQTMNASAPVTAAPKTPMPQMSTSAQVSIPSMTPGATMQAMANFQQAAAAAMQAAMQGMQSIPGVNMSQLAATPAGANAQQAYTDTMTALAMQQAAAAAGHQFMMQQPGMQAMMPFPMMAWAPQMQQVAHAQQQQQPPANNHSMMEGDHK